MNVKEIKKGAIISYILIVVNTLYGLFFTPFLITKLGDGEYGVYKMISSFVGAISIMDMGIGSTMLRFVANFHAKKEKKEINNFFAMGMIQGAIICLAIVAAGTGMFFTIDNVYGRSLSNSELFKAKQLFVLFLIILVFSIFEKVIFGVLSGCECYAFANTLKLLKILSKVAISCLILSFIADSAFLLYIEITILLITMVVQLIYLKKKLNIKIKLYKWDYSHFKSSLKYTVLTFMQSIAVQFNGNLDNMVIGAYIGAGAVAVYSVGLQIYNMYEHFALAFSDLMLPTVSKQIAVGATNRELENTVIKIGRLEFMALGAALCGFAILGREFIILWVGESYISAWCVSLILMIPTTIPLVQNVCLSILRAKNKIGFRTIAVCAMAVFNLVITIIGVKYFGMIAACVGTAVGLICANIIAMNIYYVKVIKLDVFRIFKEIFSRSWLCCLIASLVVAVLNRFTGGSWLLWIVKVFCFIIVYGLLLLCFGFNKSEKKVLLGRISRRKGECT